MIFVLRVFGSFFDLLVIIWNWNNIKKLLCFVLGVFVVKNLLCIWKSKVLIRCIIWKGVFWNIWKLCYWNNYCGKVSVLFLIIVLLWIIIWKKVNMINVMFVVVLLLSRKKNINIIKLVLVVIVVMKYWVWIKSVVLFSVKNKFVWFGNGVNSIWVVISVCWCNNEELKSGCIRMCKGIRVSVL